MEGDWRWLGDERRRHSVVHMDRILHVEMRVALWFLVHEVVCEGRTDKT